MIDFLINILLPGVLIFAIIYMIVNFAFDIILRGFLPFMPSRPWVVEQLLTALDLPTNKKIKCIALSTGRSGFFHALEKKYPKADLLGVELELVPYLVAWFQTLIRNTRIEIKHLSVHRVNIRDANFIYIHLDPDEMRDIGKKLRFECQTDTIVISTGFNIPYLQPKKIIDLPDRKGRLDWLSKNMKFLSRKTKRFKKEKKAYYYII
jgi:hypothetical protein